MRLPEEFSFSCPLKINCGSRALSHLPGELSAVNANAPLIIANHKQLGKRRLNRVIDAFKTSGLTLGLFDRLPTQIDPDLIPVLAQIYREGGCDSIVAVGNGSVVDTAKCLNLSISAGDGGNTVDPGPLRPLMLIATEGGNGDEVTGYASDGSRRLSSSRLFPDLALIDHHRLKTHGNGQVGLDIGAAQDK